MLFLCNKIKVLILIIENSPGFSDIIKESMKESHIFIKTLSPENALNFLEKTKPDLIVSETSFDNPTSFKICKAIKSNKETSKIPFIFLSVLNTFENKTKAFELGASDYIILPFEPEEIRLRLKNHIDAHLEKQSLIKQNQILKNKIKTKNIELNLIKETIAEAMASLTECRDAETAGHLKRTSEYIKIISTELKRKNKFKNLLSDKYINLLHKAAPLHDIGKIGIPDKILSKKGPLNTKEYEIMKTHTTLGKNALKKAERKAGENPFLETAEEIAFTHQEKWDGSGYPQGLKGDEIPLSGRLMAIADVYDALISKRVYKQAFSHDKSVTLIKQLKGIHFDPEITDTFISINHEFKKISQKFTDLKNSECANPC
ncbi:MAG: HD domain-containing phosphohydrolase [Desulforegulaceae bacterium]|nr:HD domain-containing phosphohydrolase [Desulforegulaceae bacterium]